MVPFTNIQIKWIQIMFLMNLNRHGPCCVIKTFVKPLPSWAALVNLFVLKVFQNIAVAIAVFSFITSEFGVKWRSKPWNTLRAEIRRSCFSGMRRILMKKDTVWVPHLFLTHSNMTVTVLRRLVGILEDVSKWTSLFKSV